MEVVVSFQSIISSYTVTINLFIFSITSFRLLSEYRFFLWLLLEEKPNQLELFPSPFRVSFLLIIKFKIVFESMKYCFRLLSEHHFFLSAFNPSNEEEEKGFRLLSEYHFFLWTMAWYNRIKTRAVSVSFQSIISSY